jgi:hypothetical protein
MNGEESRYSSSRAHHEWRRAAVFSDLDVIMTGDFYGSDSVSPNVDYANGGSLQGLMTAWAW